MNLLFDESFQKSIKKLNNPKLKLSLTNLLLAFEEAEQLSDMPNIKKMKGFPTYYRARIGDYRVGFELLKPDTVLFILVAHRKDIYNRFP